MMSLSLYEKLVKRINSELRIPVTKIERVYRGYWTKSAGCWSWVGFDVNGYEIVGSVYTATELLKSKKIVALNVGYGDKEIFPEGK